MSGITSSVGLISGIDTGGLIEQLLQIEARPRTLAQQRLVQLQTQQAAYLDINTRLSALRTASSTFRNDKVFSTSKATSSDDAVMTATASTSAQPGSYQFIVDRLVTTQQQLSKGFSDRDSSPFGATSFTFESDKGRLDSDIGLADLNGGAGVRRGKFNLTDSTGATAWAASPRPTSASPAPRSGAHSQANASTTPRARHRSDSSTVATASKPPTPSARARSTSPSASMPPTSKSSWASKPRPSPTPTRAKTPPRQRRQPPRSTT